MLSFNEYLCHYQVFIPMTKISKKSAYPIKNPLSRDFFVGSDSENSNKTVNFSFDEAANLINKINGSLLVNYMFKKDNKIDFALLNQGVSLSEVNSNPANQDLAVFTEGVFVSESNQSDINSITKLYFHKNNFHEDDLTELFLFIKQNVGFFYIKLQNASNLVTCVYFNVTNVTNHSEYFELDVSIYKSNDALSTLFDSDVYVFDFDLRSQGLQGIQGETGISGTNGIDGEVGIQGEQGTSGLNGSQGIQGPQGNTGVGGQDGTQGPQGIQGDDGLTGEQGIKGTQGEPGNPGNDGNTGTQGEQGIQGVAGQNGADGEQGVQGVQGEPGTSGSGGTAGTQGEQGIQGVPGEDGADGAQGPQGSQGVAGASGNDGADGAQGEQGIQGESGVDGANGLDGNQGVQGEPGVDGTNGSQGIQGDQGVDGTNGIQGEQGESGVNGTDKTSGNYQQVSADYQVLSTDEGVKVLTAANTITLATAGMTTEVQKFYIFNDSNGDNTISGIIDGVQDLVITTNDVIGLFWNGSSYDLMFKKKDVEAVNNGGRTASYKEDWFSESNLSLSNIFQSRETNVSDLFTQFIYFQHDGFAEDDLKEIIIDAIYDESFSSSENRSFLSIVSLGCTDDAEVQGANPNANLGAGAVIAITDPNAFGNGITSGLFQWDLFSLSNYTATSIASFNFSITNTSGVSARGIIFTISTQDTAFFDEDTVTFANNPNDGTIVKTQTISIPAGIVIRDILVTLTQAQLALCLGKFVLVRIVRVNDVLDGGVNVSSKEGAIIPKLSFNAQINY